MCLLISHPHAELFFGLLKRIVLDELHALVTSKCGELLSLALARIASLAPDLQIEALSATVARLDLLTDWIARPVPARLTHLLGTSSGALPVLEILASEQRIPWVGHSANYAHADL